MSTANNNLPARRYERQLKDLMQAVFEVNAAFGPAYGGQLEALDGVRDNEEAFIVKTSDIPVVIGEYSTDADVGMGTGTSKSTRFGEMKEIIYTNTPAKYTWSWAFNEGLDLHTVNNDLNAAVADRLTLQAQAKVRMMNKHHGKFISGYAGETLELASMEDKDILALFNEASVKYADLEVSQRPRAYVTPELFNRIVDLAITTTGKHSAANIDQNTIQDFKGFSITRVATQNFVTDEIAYFAPDNIFKAFTGINTSRTIETPDFDGLALQGSGLAGEFGLDDNKKAVFKVKLGSKE